MKKKTKTEFKSYCLDTHKHMHRIECFTWTTKLVGNIERSMQFSEFSRLLHA